MERAGVRTEPRSKWARQLAKEETTPEGQHSVGRRHSDRRAWSVAAQAAGTPKRSVHKKTGDRWELLGELFCGGQ